MRPIAASRPTMAPMTREAELGADAGSLSGGCDWKRG